jgi:hypothetical protein
LVRKICELQYTKKVFASHFKSAATDLHALAKKKKMGLQKRSQNFACFGRVKKTISKALGQIPMHWEALQKRWGKIVCFWP